MEKQPLEICLKIASYLDIPDLLTCRLVSQSWNQSVDIHLARVTHVKLNQNGFDDSPVPKILFDKLYAQNFKCHSQAIKEFFIFISKKCPHLKVFSATKSKMEEANVAKLPNGLVYFEADCFAKEQTNPFDQRFTSLIATDGKYFCSCNLTSMVKYSNVCRGQVGHRRRHKKVESLTEEELRCLRWYEHHEKPQKPEKLPNCPGIEILKVDHYCPRFEYPNLKYIKGKYLDTGLENFIWSAGHSTQLRAIELDFVQQGERFLEFTATLEHLEFLKLKFVTSSNPSEVLSVFLNENLSLLWLETSKPIRFINEKHNKLKFLRLSSKRSESLVFSFPSLTEASVTFDYCDKFSTDTIDSLRHSPRLKRLELLFDHYCTYNQAGHIISLMSELKSLVDIRIQARCHSCWADSDAPVLDISRHHDLQRIVFNFELGRCPTFVLSIGKLFYQQLIYNSCELVLKKDQLDYRSLTIETVNCRLTFVPDPDHTWSMRTSMVTYEKCLLLEEMKIFLIGKVVDMLPSFTKVICHLPRLKLLSLETSFYYNLPLHEVNSFLDEIAKVTFLESLELDVSIEGASDDLKVDRVLFDARMLKSLKKVDVILRCLKINSGRMQVVLILGDFYQKIEFEDENSVQGELVDGGCLNVFLPMNSEVIFAEPMDKLQSLSIQNWNLIGHKSRLSKICKSVESLKLKSFDGIQSLVPEFNAFPNMKTLKFLTPFQPSRQLKTNQSLDSLCTLM